MGTDRRFPRAIVLGAGSSTAGAFSCGALRALDIVGLGLTDEDLLVGTSAGALMSALLRGGLTPEQMETAVRTELRVMPSGLASAVELGRKLDAITITDLVRLWRPGSTQRPLDAMDEVAASVPEQWPDNTAVVVFDIMRSRRRLLDGSSGVPYRTAVAASLAVPGVFRPVSIDGRPHCDGGVLSRTNAPLVLDCADHVVVVNTTGAAQWPSRTAPHLIHRRLASARLMLETRRAKALIIEPDIDMFIGRPENSRLRLMETFQHGVAVTLQRLGTGEACSQV